MCYYQFCEFLETEHDLSGSMFAFSDVLAAFDSSSLEGSLVVMIYLQTDTLFGLLFVLQLTKCQLSRTANSLRMLSYFKKEKLVFHLLVVT